MAELASTNVPSNTVSVALTPNPDGGCPTAGGPVVVTVTRVYPMTFTSLVGVDELNLVGKAEMLFFGNDQAQAPAPAVVIASDPSPDAARV